MRFRRLAAGCLMLSCISGQALAYDHKYAAEFLSIGVGARALGMGGAFSAIADDVSAAYWNPAGLRLLQSRQIIAMHSAQFGNEVKHDYLAFGIPAGQEAYGISLIRMGIDDIPYTENAFNDWGLDNIPPGEPGDSSDDDYDPLENPEGTEGNNRWDPYDADSHPDLPGEGINEDEIEYKNDVEMALMLSYAKPVSEHLTLGVNAKFLRQGIGDSSILGLSGDDSMFGFGLDLGALYQLKSWWRMGASLQDALGTLLIWNNGTRNTRAPSLKLGNALFHETMNGQIMLIGAIDFDIRFEGRETASQFSSGALSADIRAGAEIEYRKAVALRIGAEPSSKDTEPYGRAWNMTLGAGLRVLSFALDYAFSQHPALDETHRISMGFNL